MNRIHSMPFSAYFTARVRDGWPDRRELIAIDGRTSRRCANRAAGNPPLHLVSAFVTTGRLVL
jgi:hypothetical protein